MKEITLWYRRVVDKLHPDGFWDFNHIDDGYDPNIKHPRSKVKEHDKMWKGGEWCATRGVINEENVIVERDTI